MARRPRRKTGSHRWPGRPPRPRPTWKVVAAALGGAGLVLAVMYFRPRDDDPTESEHPHPAAAHGGTVVPVADGRDHYHIEAVVERGGVLRVYVLGADASRVVAVETQRLTAEVRSAREGRPVVVGLDPEPQPDDPIGQTSRFVGMLPTAVRGRAVVITIPGLRIAGNHFTPEVAAAGDAPSPAMPAPVPDPERLFLSAGGKYTEADIHANGRRTAAEKYRGFSPRHEYDPVPGDRVCPVSRAKAQADCSWIIGGQTYYFCCPPCVDAFVRTAKERPESVRPAEAYRRD